MTGPKGETVAPPPPSYGPPPPSYGPPPVPVPAPLPAYGGGPIGLTHPHGGHHGGFQRQQSRPPPQQTVLTFGAPPPRPVFPSQKREVRQFPQENKERASQDNNSWEAVEIVEHLKAPSSRSGLPDILRDENLEGSQWEEYDFQNLIEEEAPPVRSKFAGHEYKNGQLKKFPTFKPSSEFQVKSCKMLSSND